MRSAGGRENDDRLEPSTGFRRRDPIIAREATQVKEAVAGCNTFDAGLFRIGIREHMPRSVESTNLVEL